MKRHYDKQRQYRSPQSEIKRLEEAIRREQDDTEREILQQKIEHWIRTQNNHS